jgi:anti-sigma B factor antagonist
MAPALGSGARCLRLDMGEVVFLDSTALGAIVALMKRLGPGRRMELERVGPRLMRIFELTGMNRVLTIHGPGARD